MCTATGCQPNVYCHRVSTKCVLPPVVNPIAVDKYIRYQILHVVANLICVFLVSCQLVLLSDVTKFLQSFYCQKKVYWAVLLRNLIATEVCRYLSLFLRSKISLQYTKWGQPEHTNILKLPHSFHSHPQPNHFLRSHFLFS
jgi:hypothetical protein